MIDRYNKLTEAIPNVHMNHCSLHLLEKRATNYGIPPRLLTDNGPQLVSNCFATLCSNLNMNNITTTEYCVQTNGQSERFIFPSMSRLQRYVSEDRRSNWLGHVSATVNTQLLCKGSQVYQSVTLMTDEYVNRT